MNLIDTNNKARNNKFLILFQKKKEKSRFFVSRSAVKKGRNDRHNFFYLKFEAHITAIKFAFGKLFQCHFKT